ncbi:MAG: ABC transporter permease [Euryarchaeota archaeon]|nr:ABC transporter permease [Euryarchaeota archaeon]MBU4139567.1 ABC transporter permease [Euryarchaeota archaeon]
MYAKIAFKGLLRRKWRTLFTSIAIALAVSIMILLVSVGVGLKQGTAMMYEKDVDYWIIPKDSSVTDIVSNSEKTMLGNVHQSIGNISSNPDIRYATPVLNRMLYASNEKEPKLILGLGLIPGNTDKFSIPTNNLTQGDPRFYGKPQTGEILINEKTARLFDLKIGDSVRLGGSSNRLNTSFTVKGIFSETQYSLSPVVVLHLSELQELTGNLRGDRANYIIAQGSNVLDYLRKYFPDTEVMGNSEYSTYSVVSDTKILATAAAVSIVSMLIAVLFISSTMIVSIHEKQHEFALMMAIGISQRSIAKIVIYESIFLSALGAIMGILLSYLGQFVLNMAADRLFEVGQIAVVDPILFIGGITIALFAGIFSGLLPVFMTQRINIVRTLADK